jgi:glucose/arabinose dehydrogenase
MRNVLSWVASLLALPLVILPVAHAGVVDALRVPPGFTVEVLAEVPSARAMTMGDNGTLFVGTLTTGRVYAVIDALGEAPEVVAFSGELDIPTGVAFADGDLYVAEPGRVLRYRDAESRLRNPGEPEVIAEGIPAQKRHQWKDIAFGPDGKLYVTVGAPCNVCAEEGYGEIITMTRDGDGQEVFAQGVRNPLGLAWHPVTGDLWFTDNNRDMMGDDLPPGELNRAPQAGMHFGFPFCHGTAIAEPEAELAALGDCADAEPPARELPAHVAALGLAVYRGDMFPPAYQNQIFIAEHGSWNRSEKIGYRVSLVRLDVTGEKAVDYQPFVEGWLDDGEVSGRPVDVLVAPDGSLLVSDDRGGKIFRISHVTD